MNNKETEFLSFREIARSIDAFSIQNFFISGSDSFTDQIPINHPFASDGIIFGICTSGSGILKIDYTEYELKTNTLSVILPGHIFEIIDKTEDLRVEALLFSIDFFTYLTISNFDIAGNIGRQPCLDISCEEAQTITDFHKTIIKEFERDRIYKEEIIRHLLIAMLLSMSELYIKAKVHIKSQNQSRDEEIKDLFMKILFDSKGLIRDPDYFSDKIFITTKHLSTVLKRATGRSLNSWINESVILKAKMLIKTTNKSIFQISEEMNFPNPSFFSKFFKKHAGVTPIQYKKS